MKKLYWRPPNLSRTALGLVALLAVALMVAVESVPVVTSHLDGCAGSARTGLPSQAAVVVTDSGEPKVELLDKNGNQVFKAPR